MARCGSAGCRTRMQVYWTTASGRACFRIFPIGRRPSWDKSARASHAELPPLDLPRPRLTVRKVLSHESLPAALTVPIEDPGKRPDERRKDAGLNFDPVRVPASVRSRLDRNPVVPP